MNLHGICLIPGLVPGSPVHYTRQISPALTKIRANFSGKTPGKFHSETHLRYLEQYPDGGYRYQRGVPSELVKLVGTGKRIKRHIGHTGIREAEDRAARYAIEEASELFARLRRLPAQDKAQLEALGGWWKIKEKPASPLLCQSSRRCRRCLEACLTRQHLCLRR